MIAPDAKPRRHDPPYKRIDIAHIGRKAVITAEELAQSGGREPDPAAYRYDAVLRTYLLKDG
jgi:hypothetical protein